MITGEHTLKNGRKYFVYDTKQPYINQEYPSGGFVISSWLETENFKGWVFISNSPDESCVEEFFRLVSRHKP
jgi:hypothetical protein